MISAALKKEKDSYFSRRRPRGGLHYLVGALITFSFN